MIEFRGKSYGCHMEVTLDLIGGKWKALLLWHLGQAQVLRFGELWKLHPKLTAKMLAQQLRELEADGIVERTVYQQIPPKVEYSLSPVGRRLAPVLEAMIGWGQGYLGEIGPCTKPKSVESSPLPEEAYSLRAPIASASDLAKAGRSGSRAPME